MSFSDVSGASKYFVTPNEGFSTTTSGTVASGAATVGLNSVSGLTNGTTFVGVIEPAGTKEQIFTGVVDTSGSQITGVVWTKGSNIDHATGVSVVDYDTGTALKLMTTGLLKEHNQAGTHAAVTATSVTATGALTGTSLVNAVHTHANNAGGGQLTGSTAITAGTVTNALLSTAAGEVGGAWQSWTPTFTNWTIGTGGSAATDAKYIQQGKVVHFRLKSALGTSGQSVGSNPTFTLPVTSVTVPDTNMVITNVGIASYNGSSQTPIFATWASTTTAGLKRWDANNDLGSITSSLPGVWTSGGAILLEGFYEAA